MDFLRAVPAKVAVTFFSNDAEKFPEIRIAGTHCEAVGLTHSRHGQNRDRQVEVLDQAAEAVARSACLLAEDVDAAAIVATTMSR